MSDFYAYTDKALTYLRRFYVTQFNSTKMQIRADNVNVITPITNLYDRMRKETIRVFLKIANEKYRECGGDTLAEMWLLGFLAYSNPLTGYIFLNDIERKRQYFTESVMSGENLEKASKKAMRLWYGSVRQFADLVTDAAAIQAYYDTGIKTVQWVTQKDEHVCPECHARDGKTYPVKKVPTKPHYGCRCWIRGVE